MAISPANTISRCNAEQTTAITLQFNDSTGAAINLTGWTVAAQAWNQDRSTKYADFTVTYTNRVTGTIAIALTRRANCHATQRGPTTTCC
jgi:NAD dependent epimerase/dehydratase family enzyme